MIGNICTRHLPFLLLPFSCCTAADYPEMLVETGSNVILHQQEARRSWHPASLTKMMTLYLTFMALQDETLTLEESVEVSPHASSQPSTRLGLSSGETISVENAILAVATVSANDAAVVLAERIATTEEAFARQMTEEAGKLGMSESVFRNANGLPDDAQVITARDMVILGTRLLQDFPQYFHFFSNRTFAFKGRRRSTTNGLIGSVTGTDGIKTGFTCHSGYNIVISAERSGVRLIAVVLGSGSSGSRNRRARQLLEEGFKKIEEQAEGTPIATLNELPPDERPPPQRFSQTECQERTILTRTPLPGWGLLIGIYASKRQANAAARKSRATAAEVIGGSRMAILRRSFNKRTTWKVLLVGLTKKSAGKACIHLWSREMQCVAQSPQRMKLPGYALR
ncbi:MAG: D-alanyl-D-alanine carboxypeptidase [Gammaproteobacteria bacterium]|nr:D-alanyl-D-alanine carboxypeptidase [Gammaproteobacteria bacterium]